MMRTGMRIQSSIFEVAVATKSMYYFQKNCYPLNMPCELYTIQKKFENVHFYTDKDLHLLNTKQHIIFSVVIISRQLKLWKVFAYHWKNNFFRN